MRGRQRRTELLSAHFVHSALTQHADWSDHWSRRLSRKNVVRAAFACSIPSRLKQHGGTPLYLIVSGCSRDGPAFVTPAVPAAQTPGGSAWCLQWRQRRAGRCCGGPACASIIVTSAAAPTAGSPPCREEAPRGQCARLGTACRSVARRRRPWPLGTTRSWVVWRDWTWARQAAKVIPRRRARRPLRLGDTWAGKQPLAAGRQPAAAMEQRWWGRGCSGGGSSSNRAGRRGADMRQALTVPQAAPRAGVHNRTERGNGTRATGHSIRNTRGSTATTATTAAEPAAPARRP